MKVTIIPLSRSASLTTRVVLFPARLALRVPGVRRGLADVAGAAVAAASPRIERSVDELLQGPEVARIAERACAGPLPETVARSLARNHVVERMVREMLEMRDAVPPDPEFEHDVQLMLTSSTVQAALSTSRSTLTGELGRALRRRGAEADSAVERRPRRWLGRPARLETDVRTGGFAGFATRGTALVLDAALLTFVYVSAVAVVNLLWSMVGRFGPSWLPDSLAVAGWALLQIAYFAGFWTTVGQTPGMSFMRVRVVGGRGSPPGTAQSLVRVFGLALSIALVFTGFLPVLVDDRRRGLADYLAQTTVVYTADEPED